ncbi:hypothetical protein D3C72_2131050 [compost metagenome]
MMAMKAERVATLARLVRPMKFGLTIAPMIKSRSRAAKGATALKSTSRQVRRPRMSVALSVSVVIVSRLLRQPAQVGGCAVPCLLSQPGLAARPSFAEKPSQLAIWRFRPAA